MLYFIQLTEVGGASGKAIASLKVTPSAFFDRCATRPGLLGAQRFLDRSYVLCRQLVAPSDPPDDPPTPDQSEHALFHGCARVLICPMDCMNSRVRSVAVGGSWNLVTGESGANKSCSRTRSAKEYGSASAIACGGLGLPQVARVARPAR